MAIANKSPRVSFDNVTVYEFSSAIGTHAGVRDGIPIRLDQLLSQTTMPVEKREKRPLVRLSRAQRVDRLHDYGVDDLEIEVAEAAILHDHMMKTAREIMAFFEAEKKEQSRRRGIRGILDRKPWKKSRSSKTRSVSPPPSVPASPPPSVPSSPTTATTIHVEEVEVFF